MRMTWNVKYEEAVRAGLDGSRTVVVCFEPSEGLRFELRNAGREHVLLF